jgi:hypothetical protein
MKKAVGRILRIGAVIVSLLVVIILATVLLVRFNKPLIRKIVESQLSKRTGAAVRIGRLDYTFFPLHLTAQDLQIGLENKLQKVNLSLARIEAKGDIRKIIRGEKPAIETVEADGASIRFTKKAPPEKPVDYEAIVLQASQSLAWARKIAAKNTRLSVNLTSIEANLGDFDLDITPGDEKDRVTFSIGRSDVEIKDKAGAFRVKSGFAASGTLHLASSLGFDVVLSFESPVISAAGIENSPAGITLDVSGRVELAAKEITISRLKLGIPDLIELEGKARGRLDRGLSLTAEGSARIEKLENAAAFLGPRLPEGFRRAKVRGRAVLSGKYAMRRSDREMMDNVNAALAFEGVEFDHVYQGLPLHLRASGTIHASGPSKSPQLAADIRSSLGKIVMDKLRIGGTRVHITAAAAKDRVTISDLDAEFGDILFRASAKQQISLGAARLKARADLVISEPTRALHSLEARFDAGLRNLSLSVAEGKSLSFDPVMLKGKAVLDAVQRTMTVGSLEARLPGISPFFISGSFKQGEAPAAEMRLETRGLDLPALRSLAAPFIPERLAGWDLAGVADLSLDARRPSSSGKDYGFSAALALAQVRFNDPDFTIAGEGLNPAFKIDGEYSPSSGLAFNGGLDISQGESLWKAVFIPWVEHPLKVTGSGLYNPKSGDIADLKARFEMPTVGEAGLDGSVLTRPSLAFNLESNARLSLGPLYSLYTQAGAAGRNRMRLAGTIESGLHINRKGDALSVAGKVALAGTNVERPSTKTAFLDIDAEIPVLYNSGAAAAESPDGPFPEKGLVNIGEFRNPFISLKSLAIPLRAGTNAFSIEPFTQELYGGRLELGRTTVRFDPKSRLLQGLGSLALHDLDISLLPIQSPKFKLTGRVQAEFPRLDINPDKIAVSGRAEASVFGGKVVLRDLVVSHPFAPGRSISLNIDLVDLNLKKLTDEVPFGGVTGIVRGEVRNLVISYRQPERFDFRVESVPRKGVPQTFSLKAVDNLTVISSGEPASVGTGKFWMRFIRGFRYDKLGIISTLRNDTFTLNGSIREDGVEYLVKKPALFGINVINRMPEKLISFKEMAGRLRRVGQSEK